MKTLEQTCRDVADAIVGNLEGRKGVIDLDLEEELIEEIMQEMSDTIRDGVVAALGAQQEPRAWITGGDCHENGHIDCLAWREGEFTTPLYAAPVCAVPDGWLEQYDIFVSDYNKYISGDPKISFAELRESLAAFLQECERLAAAPEYKP